MKYIKWIISCIKHNYLVFYYMLQVCCKLLGRAGKHDKSKYSLFEIKGYGKVINRLANTTYGSNEYNVLLIELDITLKHHYFRNSHHPQYYENGINDMNLVDVIEMWCDWRAAVRKHKDGDILKSIEHNFKRFKMSKQLVSIFKNTVEKSGE